MPVSDSKRSAPRVCRKGWPPHIECAERASSYHRRTPRMRYIVLVLLAAAMTDIRQDHRLNGAPLPKPRWPIAVICHRAGAAIAPENTIAAIQNAIALGADYVEIDVRTTRDGKLVIM